MREKVTIIGTLNMETIFQGINKFSDWGRQIFSKDYSLIPAGSALRVALPLSRLGIKSYLIGKVGEDIYGREILKSIKNHDLSCKGIKKEKNLQTGICMCMVRKDGERSIISFLGSVSATDEDLINRYFELIEKTDFLLITGYFCLTGIKKKDWKRIFQKAKADGKYILLDTGWNVQNWQSGGREEILYLLPMVDTFLPNRDEAKALSGKRSPEEMAVYLHKKGAKKVIIKLGQEGSAGYSLEEGFIKRPALSVKVIDTTAAGEAFNAGIVWGLVQGWKLEQRLKFANTLAGLFISNPKKRYPTLKEVKQNMEVLEDAKK